MKPTLDLVDVEKPDTWPVPVYQWANHEADELRGSTEYTSDLGRPYEDAPDFRALLIGHPLRAFHATRLLDHERDMIRDRGLRPLSADLLDERIRAAYEHGHIDAGVRDRLISGHVFAKREHAYREDRVSLFLGSQPLRDRFSGIGNLMHFWGGEGIFKTSDGVQLRPLLQELGTPTIVVTGIDLSGGSETHQVSPSLHKLFVGRLLKLADIVASVAYRAPIPPEDIVGIWQPGIPEYDSFELLPR